ncbi:hypothetical protein AgCh_035942 [Apium graveolens]
MSVYIGREDSKRWRIICAETTAEISLLIENWKYLLAGLIGQYMHGVAARGVHFIHRPGPVLQDTGFLLLKELGQERAYVSETVFTFIFASFLLGCQALRILTFYSTQLPGPNYHCRESLLIIASRKHYTVDVVVAWYTVNLVVYYIDSKLPEMPDRGAAAVLLPVTKDSRTKEENHKLLNGNAGDPTDMRLRSQVNGKGVEDSNTIISETVLNSV